MMRVFQRGLHVLPLLGALFLLRYLPLIAETPPGGLWWLPWRLDALTLVFLIVLLVGLAVLPLRWRDTLLAGLSLMLLVPALLLEHILALPAVLIIISIALRNWRWLCAAVALAIALGLLYITGAAGWNDPLTATALTAPIFLVLLAAVCTGLNIYPIALLHEKYDPLRLMLQPIWLLPLIRTLAWGPWNNGWALATLLLGGATALWAGASAVWLSDERPRIDRIANVWLGAGLACVGLLTPVGLASTLWQLLAFTVGMGLLFRAGRWRFWAAPVPLTATFVAGWLALGASAASGAWLIAAALWLATLLNGIAIFRLEATTSDPVQTAPARNSWPLALSSLVLGVLAPIPLRWLIVPAVDLAQGGLTPFGLIDIWPWVGLAALDAGQRRVAVLPSIAVAVQALVIAALIWVITRLLAGRNEADQSPGHTDLWTTIQRRVWWAGRARRG